MRITDLMDDYYEESVTLPEADAPTAERTKELTMQKLGAVQKKRRRVPVGALIAAACVLVFSVTAGAVGYSLWDAARNDVGLAASEDIPEYTEYRDVKKAQSAVPHSDVSLETAQKESEVEEPKAELVSTLCSGSDVTAYVSVSPVTQEMADTPANSVENHWESYVEYGWNAEGAAFPEDTKLTMQQGSSWVELVEYDAESQTALLCCELTSDGYAYCDEIKLSLTWLTLSGREQVDDHIYEHYDPSEYGTLTVPITPAETLHFDTALEFASEYELLEQTAVLRGIDLQAKSISFTYEFQSFAEICSEYGENAYTVIGEAADSYNRNRAAQDGITLPDRTTEYDEFGAKSDYWWSWVGGLQTQMKDAYITLVDGTEVSLAGLQGTTSDLPTDTDTRWTEEFRLSGAVDLSQVASITIGGETFSVE